MFPKKSSCDDQSHQKLRPKKRKMLIMMRMKPQAHFSVQIQLSTQNIVEVHVTHFGKHFAYVFVILFQESWMNKTCTGSQGVDFGRLKQVFNIKKIIMPILFSTVPLTFYSSIIIFSNKSACDFGPSG